MAVYDVLRHLSDVSTHHNCSGGRIRTSNLLSAIHAKDILGITDSVSSLSSAAFSADGIGHAHQRRLDRLSFVVLDV